MSNPLRKAFIDSLKDELYDHLKKDTIFRKMEYGTLISYVRSIIESKTDEINEYLDTNQVTLRDSEKAAQKILKEILLPELYKMKI